MFFYLAFVNKLSKRLNVQKMNRFIFCLILILTLGDVKCDCDTYVDCFNEFFESFFAENNSSKIENVKSDNLPENFDQIKDIQESDLSKVISELQSFINSDSAHRIKNEPDSTILEKVNGNTKIYVQGFNHNIDLEKILNPLTKIDQNDEKRVLTESPIKIETTTIKNKSNTTNNKPKKENFKINEIPKLENQNYYDILDDNTTDYPIIDYVELYKDTTNEELVYDVTSTTVSVRDEIVEKIDDFSVEVDSPDNGTSRLQCHGKTKGIKQVLPWLAAIFIKEKAGSDQFSYYCDGVLVQDRFLITAGRCMKDQNGTTVNPNDVLVFLGKRSLQVVSESEKTVRISKVQIHNNFTSRDGNLFENDLAILKMEEAVKSSDVIRPACLDDEKLDEVEQTATVAWTQTGDLTPVYFEKNSKCTDVDDIVCATYGNNVALCPNYGGIYAVRRSKQWYVHGIRTGDPSDRNICFDKNLKYTSLDNYMDWILDNTNN